MHHKHWGQVQSNSQVHEASLRDKVLQPRAQVKLHHFRRLNSSLCEYLFIEHIANLAVQCIVQLLLSCLRHAMQIGLTLLLLSLEYLKQLPVVSTDGIWIH